LAEIATEVGVGRQAVYKWPAFLRAAQLAGKYSPQGHRGQPPHGTKSDGHVEAWRDPDQK
jgi:hypothetical protein